MTEHEAGGEAWTTRGERGATAAIRLIVWIAMNLGRPATRLLLYPICLYFLAFSKASRHASGIYLRHVLGREPGIGDRFHHYHCFAACVLDRVYLLNNQLDLFEVHADGEEIAEAEIDRGEGCFLFGAHLGSFEILRALGHRQPNLKLSLLMYEENARKINSVLNAINPDLTIEVIALGQPGAMLAVEQRLDQGHLIAILADRGLSLDGEENVNVEFLGDNARFPLGPFRLAALLRRRVILMVGLYRGGQCYDVYFERLADFTDVTRETRPKAIEDAVRYYVGRLEHFCRMAPDNWFNFYNFWQ
jgi:predicted LPLAT superfamily acyltransferase